MVDHGQNAATVVSVVSDVVDVHEGLEIVDFKFPGLISPGTLFHHAERLWHTFKNLEELKHSCCLL